MKNLKIISKAIILSALFSSPAYAYVDGGTALLLFQGFFGALGTALMFIKNPWKSIVRIFSRKKNRRRQEKD